MIGADASTRRGTRWGGGPRGAAVSPRAAMTGPLVSWEAPSARWRYENGPDQDSRSAGIGDEAVPVRVQAEGCRMKIGPNRKSRFIVLCTLALVLVGRAAISAESSV